MAKKATRKQHGRRSANRGGVRDAALPALDGLSDLPGFADLAPSQAQLDQFGQVRDAIAREQDVPLGELVLGCVVRLDRGFPAVVHEGGLIRAEFSIALTKAGKVKGDNVPADNSRVAVGDWVCVRIPAGHEMGLICKILDRRSDIARWRGKARGEKQTLAANVDTVLVAQALGADGLSLDRMTRSAVIAYDCGADVAIVLTKADRAGAELLGDYLGKIRGVLGDVPVAVTSAGAHHGRSGDGSDVSEVDMAELERVAHEHGAAWGNAGVRSLVPEGAIAIVLGESGAGKSTLLNSLLGREALETGAVRSSDDMGRHTTVARRMVLLPGAGVIVDEPGLRSLPIVGHERGLARVFPHIAEAAAQCRFRDCTHTHEPGCEVRARLEQNVFKKDEVDAYVALAGEMRASAQELDPDVVI